MNIPGYSANAAPDWAAAAVVERLAARAADLLPGGGSHDFRQWEPAGLFVREGRAGRKVTVDGRDIIDLSLGNGALLFGHGHAAVIQAVASALSHGLHFSATTEAELDWAEWIRRLVPSAERVRFTASGNEAVLLAVAVARRLTGRTGLVSLAGHHFGWALPAVGVDVETAADVSSLIARLADGGHALCLLEPTGAAFGKAPLAAADLARILAAARRVGTLVLFDETLTGFRVAPGGVQGLTGLHPDLTVLGKILGGGLPCGALAGPASVLSVLDNRVSRQGHGPHVAHGGTHNGHPLVAAAGVATLTALADGAAGRAADAAAADLRGRLNRLFARLDVPWAAYGTHSAAHLFLNPLGADLDPVTWTPDDSDAATLLHRDAALINDLRVALLSGGVDLNGWPGAMTCTVHDADDLDRVEQGFATAIHILRRKGATLSGWGKPHA